MRQDTNDTKITRLRKRIDWLLLYLSLGCAIAILAHTGYQEHFYLDNWFNQGIIVLFYCITCVLCIRAVSNFLVRKSLLKSRYPELALALYFILIILDRQFHLLFPYNDPAWVYLGFFAVFIVELSKNVLFFDRFYFSPTLLFIISFLFMIFIGTVLLLLPNVMVGPPLNFVDALFMATSAVCITGLTVVDVSADFTSFGQTILIVLVQLGGLGIMTFTGFFGYFFSGGFSYKNQLMYTELLGEKKLNSVIGTLLKIIFVTLLFEAIGAILIFQSTSDKLFPSVHDHFFFAVFHAISAFCNAGFSTVRDGLYHPSLRFNSSLHMVLALLFILGGLGFTIVFNTFTFIKRWIKNFYFKLVHHRPFKYRPWVINFNARLIGYTSLFLLVLGTLAIFILESGHSLSHYDTTWAKLIDAFFIGATPRSAGLSPIDPNTLRLSSIFILLWLMWIGASPGSTGGGIKTTTFAVATLNLFSLAKGKDHIEIFRRGISRDSVRRAFAVIALSIIGIGLCIFGLTLTDGDKNPIALVFESFSAYNTVGLSMGITSTLTRGGRIILILAMFIGRVGALTLLLAFIKKRPLQNYRYPEENILF
ncbi:hypothetical protein GCM10023231_41170 [Olivibacter ginsenosidimutans]|uniref:ATPase n=1 Tax=Olivibacter ginsenosidimutans TaxID=1176537 RepID=A0ABP9CC97_9SPHI